MGLKYIEHLLLDLLELILHHDYKTLHISVIALRAESIDLAPHLLGDKTEFFAVASAGESAP